MTDFTQEQLELTKKEEDALREVNDIGKRVSEYSSDIELLYKQQIELTNVMIDLE